MNHGLVTWLLAGALAASMAWNVRTLNDAKAPACGTCASTPNSCAVALDALDLTPDQRRALEDWSRAGCGGAEELAAANVSRELFALLGSRDIDADRARALATEVGRLRTASLRSCVESVLEVRRVLTPEQTQKLIATCCRQEN